MPQLYDVIVLGAGAMGSAAAYYLSKNGQRVLVLEQFEIDHQHGSSYGNSRIIRYMYDHPAYVRLMKAAYPLWFALEKEVGEQLYFKTGGIDFGLPETPSLKITLDTVNSENIPYEIFDTVEASKRYPQFRFDDGMIVAYQSDSGILNASRCVQAHLRLAQHHGAMVYDQTPVTDIEVYPDRVKVETPRGIFEAGKLVIAAGAWTQSLMARLGVDLPLHVLRCQYSFFRPVEGDFSVGNFPIFIGHLADTIYESPYGFPDYDGRGFKVAYHGGELVKDINNINYTPDEDTPEKLRVFLQKYIPGANGEHVGSQVCLYTMTPDTHFVIDTHPEHRHIVFTTPCSGHGFKFSTLIGKMMRDLVIDQTTPHDISLFSSTRF